MSGGAAAPVTVIIPMFDAGRYIADAIDSVLAQSVPADVVVVDDGSHDDGPAVVERYGTPVRLLRHRVNRGPAAARNTAIAVSSAEYVSFLDADDRMASERLATHLEYFAMHPDAAFVLGHQELLLENGREVPVWLVQPADLLEARQSLIDVQPLGGTVRRSAFDRVGMFDESLRVSEDLDWLLRCREAGAEVLVVPEISVVRRIHDHNMSHEMSRNGEMRAAAVRAVHGVIGRRRAAGLEDGS